MDNVVQLPEKIPYMQTASLQPVRHVPRVRTTRRIAPGAGGARWTSIVCCLAATVVCGCSKPAPWASPPPSESETSRVRSALRLAAEGHEPTPRLATRPEASRSRWPALLRAVPAAAELVEMVVYRTIESSRTVYHVELRTIEGQPAFLRLERHTESADERFTGWVRVGRLMEASDRGRRLLHAIERSTNTTIELTDPQPPESPEPTKPLEPPA